MPQHHLTLLLLVGCTCGAMQWPRSRKEPGDRAPPKCHGGGCSSLVHYPVQGTTHYAEFNVPELPLKIGPTWFAYYNIDFQVHRHSRCVQRHPQSQPHLLHAAASATLLALAVRCSLRAAASVSAFASTLAVCGSLCMHLCSRPLALKAQMPE